MTRKDYQLIAHHISRASRGWETGVTPDQVTRYLATELAYALAQENPRFNRERFLTACGVKI